MRYAIAIALCAALPVNADITARFIEGAPTDRFELTHTEGCALGPADMVLSLAGSGAGLIFDTTASGAGVQVFQPFVLVAGADLITKAPDVRDGDQVLDLSLRGLSEGESVAFTIDVDDTRGTRQTLISDSEIAGATVTLLTGGVATTAIFASDGRATLPLAACTS